MIIAEIGANHRGSLGHAQDLVLAAYESGAEAVKFQAYRPEDMTLDLDRFEFRIKKGLWRERKLFDIYKEGATPFEWLPQLFDTARNLGLVPFASVFSNEAVDFLEGLSPTYYKIASFEISDIELIYHAARTGKHLIISTGVASDSEIYRAMIAASMYGGATLLHCVSSYPAEAEEYNLQNIVNLRAKFDCNVGLSDHSLSTTLPAVATALGATMIEKHFCISRRWGGLDAAFSLEPHEFKVMASAVKEARKALTPYQKDPEYAALKRSLYVVKPIRCDETITYENVKAIRPGYGMEPYLLHSLIGKRVKRDLEVGTALQPDMVSNEKREIYSGI